MAEYLIVKMHDAEQGHLAITHLWKQAKQWLLDGKKLQVEVHPEIREERHSKHFHSLINQISDQVGGPLADKDDAKRILISAFRIDTSNDVEFRDEWARFGQIRMSSGLRGEVVMLGTQTKRFSNKLAKGFIEWLYAFGSENDVRFKPWEPNQ